MDSARCRDGEIREERHQLSAGDNTRNLSPLGRLELEGAERAKPVLRQKDLQTTEDRRSERSDFPGGTAVKRTRPRLVPES